jgi:hypothetical protein
MPGIVACCGFRCDLCLIYRDNLINDPQNRQRFREGVQKYYGDKLTLEECYCDGCLTPDSENPVRITADCAVRPCVIARGLDNCAACEDYPCEALQKKFIDYGKVMAMYGGPLPGEDYQAFVFPYESRQALDEIRQKRAKS